MDTLRVCLFGRFSAQRDLQSLEGLEGDKVQELFCYVLLHRDHPQPREGLADLLWPESSPAQAKKNLRQTLWQLQLALQSHSVEPGAQHLLHAGPDWIELNAGVDFWLDVTVFERAFAKVQGVRGEELDPERASELAGAVQLHTGDLLEGWYQDWCLDERERLEGMYRAMLDKLMGSCARYGDYEGGLAYGERLLSYDRARERTHRRMMRLYYLNGDRTEALRQYERCVAALAEELGGVKPSRRTVALYEQLRADSLGGAVFSFDDASVPSLGEHLRPLDLFGRLKQSLGHLRQLRSALVDVQERLQREIQTVEQALEDHR